MASCDIGRRIAEDPTTEQSKHICRVLRADEIGISDDEQGGRLDCPLSKKFCLAAFDVACLLIFHSSFLHLYQKKEPIKQVGETIPLPVRWALFHRLVM